jgi:ketosteroid isomerase-like protein
VTGADEALPATIAARFNDRINARDIAGLASLMTEDHTFIDTEGRVVSGMRDCRDAWRGFFIAYPDYRNVFTSIMTNRHTVTIVAHSVCSEAALAGPALWTATIRDDKVAGWRVYSDTPENRQRLAM